MIHFLCYSLKLHFRGPIQFADTHKHLLKCLLTSKLKVQLIHTQVNFTVYRKKNSRRQNFRM